MATRAPEKDYAKIGASRITFPSQQSLMPKILVYARNKKGKTTFLTSAGRMNILVADPEHGTSKMKTKDPHIWPIRRWADMDDFYQFCRMGLPCPKCKPEHDFTWAGVDGMTRITNMALRFVMKKEEERNLDRQPGMVDRQEEAQDSEEDPDNEAQESVYVPDLPKGVRGMTNSLVDVIGRLYVVKAVVKGEEKPQRRLWLGESTKYDTGYRSEYRLPDYVKYPSIPKLVKLMETGSAK